MPGASKPGAVDEQAVSLIDLAPTLVAVAGGSTDKLVGPLDGKATLLDDDRPAPTIYWHFPHYTNQGGRPAAAIRQRNWKLVEQLEDNHVELFDLANDPSESNSLANQNPEQVRALVGELHQWQKSIGADMPALKSPWDETLHRQLYIDVDSSKLVPARTALLTEPAWSNWRKQMNAAVLGVKPKVTPAKGTSDFSRVMPAFMRKGCVTKANLSKTCWATGPIPPTGRSGVSTSLPQADMKWKCRLAVARGAAVRWCGLMSRDNLLNGR